jgi:O-antigen ligase
VIMGFALTIVYVVAAIISLDQFGPAWANYHALTYLAGITVIASLPNIRASRYWKSSVQTFLLLGLVVAIALSNVAHGWLGGVLESFRLFLPSAAVFFFLIVNATTTRRLKIATLAAVAACLFVAVEGLIAYYTGYRGETFLLFNNVYSPQDDIIGQIIRVRGAGFLSDPNDLAQILLVALPLVFLAWQTGRWVANCFFVMLPAAVLLWTVYLTHSRGGLIALAAIGLMLFRSKLGTAPSLVLSAVFIIGMLALDFTGGRGISAADGADRLEAWANGLELFKSAPLFGIGFNAFTDQYDITAHNSFVLCLAELGLLGSTLWVALLVTTTTGLNRIFGAQQKNRAIGVQGRKQPRKLFAQLPILEASYAMSAGTLHNLDSSSEAIAWEDTVCVSEAPAAAVAEAANTETVMARPNSIVPRHWIVAMRLSLVAFMATGWFLSRSYAITLYLILGLATATIALQRSGDKSPDRSHWIFTTMVTEVLLVILIYGLVRFRH